jgi:hypothetical protein
MSVTRKHGWWYILVTLPGCLDSPEQVRRRVWLPVVAGSCRPSNSVKFDEEHCAISQGCPSDRAAAVTGLTETAGPRGQFLSGNKFLVRAFGTVDYRVWSRFGWPSMSFVKHSGFPRYFHRRFFFKRLNITMLPMYSLAVARNARNPLIQQ